MSTFEDVDRDMLRVYERWADREAEYFERSRSEYERAVRPRALYKERVGREEMELVNLSFTEWFLFEFGLEGRRTPLERFVADPPPSASEPCVRRLADVVATQRFVRCAIVEKSPEAGDVLLEDLTEGGCYLVRSPRASRRRSWLRGSLAMRIARVEGCWLQVGKTMFYDRAPVDPSLPGPGERGGGRFFEVRGEAGAEATGNDGGAGSSSYYLRFLRDVLGIDGAFSETMRVVAGR